MGNINYYFGYCLYDNASSAVQIVIHGKAIEGVSCPDIVSLEFDGRKKTGFHKKYANHFNDNDLEYVLTQIGKSLGVPMANVLRIYEDKNCMTPYALISLSVAQPGTERFVSFREMRDSLYLDLQAGTIPITPWIDAWMRIRKRKGSNHPGIWEIDAICDSEYDDCLHFPFEIAKLWCHKNKYTLLDFSEFVMKMVVFDLLIGQADRSPSNYGLLVDQQRKTAQLAPLFDNATLTKPYMRDDQNSFNQMLLKRTQLADAAYRKWGISFVNMATKIRDQQELILDVIEQSKENLSSDTIQTLRRRIHEFSDLLC